MGKSAKGRGPRLGRSRQRHHQVLAFPAWGGKKGCDVYFSSRWDNDWQIFDHFHSPKSLEVWWQTAPWEWVYVSEVPYDMDKKDFVWDDAKSPTQKELRKTRYWHKKKFHAAAAKQRGRRE